MDFEYIKTLLDVVHGSLGVPGTDNIRNAALAELADINAGNLMAPEEPVEDHKPAERKI